VLNRCPIDLPDDGAKSVPVKNSGVSMSHFTASSYAMLREIFEQPDALARTIEQYAPGTEEAALAFGPLADSFARTGRLVISASGSSRHAGLAAEIMIEDLAGIPVDVEYASEYTYRSTHALVDPGVLVISQSGETADTLAALREANARGLSTVAITNNPGSSMAIEAAVSLPTLAGVEKAIPATKSFTAQLAVLYSLALYLARFRGRMTLSAAEVYGTRLREIPELLALALPAWKQAIEDLAPALERSTTMLYLGRGVHYPMAREGALKLKESAYMNADGYPAGELKHGPSALISEETPLVVLAPRDVSDPDSLLRYGKVLQLTRELRQQGRRILAIATEGDSDMQKSSDWCLFLPPTSELLTPLLEVVPLQLLAFQLAVRRGIDVDQPRNLVKSVVAE
jgi:glucosamine--fructose-6-phosphate aminotransferase (isomerizing)